MANQVQVDELDIEREFERLELEGAAADSQAENELLEATSSPEDWMDGARMLIDILDAKVCPNWELDSGEKDNLSIAFAKVLDRYLPGATAGISNWHPVLQLAAVGGGVAALRFDWGQGRMTPMHNAKDDDSDDNTESRGRPPDGTDGREPLGENSLSFTAGQQ